MAEDIIEEKDSEPFAMCIEDVLWVTGRGLMVIGKTEENSVLPKAGDKVQIIGGLHKPLRQASVLRVQKMALLFDPLIPTNEFAIVLKDLNREDVEVGDMLVL
jgi:translation elongation factor EF-Tu-like GTPase